MRVNSFGAMYEQQIFGNDMHLNDFSFFLFFLFFSPKRKEHIIQMHACQRYK